MGLLFRMQRKIKEITVSSLSLHSLCSILFPDNWTLGCNCIFHQGLKQCVALFSLEWTVTSHCSESVNPSSSRLDNVLYSISVGNKRRSKHLPQNVFLMPWKLVSCILQVSYRVTSASHLDSEENDPPQQGACHLVYPVEIMWPWCIGTEYW